MALLNLAFKPFSILVGVLAGLLGRRIFNAIWGLIDEQEAPVAKHREVENSKLILSLVLQGAIFKLVKGLADHQLRNYYYKSTGVWPGEKVPDQK